MVFQCLPQCNKIVPYLWFSKTLYISVPALVCLSVKYPMPKHSKTAILNAVQTICHPHHCCCFRHHEQGGSKGGKSGEQFHMSLFLVPHPFLPNREVAVATATKPMQKATIRPSIPSPHSLATAGPFKQPGRAEHPMAVPVWQCACGIKGNSKLPYLLKGTKQGRSKVRA